MKTQNIFLSILMAVGVAAIIYLILKNTIWKEETKVSGEVSELETKVSGEVSELETKVSGEVSPEIQGTQVEVQRTETEIQGTQVNQAEIQVTQIEGTGAEAIVEAKAEAKSTMEESEAEDEQVPELGIPLRGPNAMVITSSSSNNLQGNNVDASIRLRSENTIATVGTVDPETGYRVYSEPIVLNSLTSSPGGSVSFTLGDNTLLRKGLKLRVTCDSCK